jgi:hypothetical protein
MLCCTQLTANLIPCLFFFLSSSSCLVLHLEYIQIIPFFSRFTIENIERSSIECHQHSLLCLMKLLSKQCVCFLWSDENDWLKQVYMFAHYESVQQSMTMMPNYCIVCLYWSNIHHQHVYWFSWFWFVLKVFFSLSKLSILLVIFITNLFDLI